LRRGIFRYSESYLLSKGQSGTRLTTGPSVKNSRGTCTPSTRPATSFSALAAHRKGTVWSCRITSVGTVTSLNRRGKSVPRKRGHAVVGGVTHKREVTVCSSSVRPGLGG
jgi:hypothetical protein